jgi:tetratricopeptide (TPR) repeat protein
MPPARSSRVPQRLRPLAARLYYLRGNFHRHFGNMSGDRREYQAAVDDFTRAIELDPAFSAAAYNRGVLYWRELQNWHRAIRDLTRVIELAPDRYEAWFNRAIAYHQRGDLAAAIADLEHYLTIAVDPGWRANAERQLALIKAVAEEKTRQKEQR